MKQNLKYMIVATILTAATLMSCNPSVLDPSDIYDPIAVENDSLKTLKEKPLGETFDISPYSDFRFVIGDTIVQFMEPILPKIPSNRPNLEMLKSIILKDEPFRILALGGSLTAGVRDGGYFNEGIATSFPNLIARQMDVSFNQPYFNPKDFNGLGRVTLTDFNPTGGPVPKFNLVQNNLAAINIENKQFQFNKVENENIDNYGLPFGGILSFWSSDLNSNVYDIEFNRKELLAAKPFQLRLLKNRFENNFQKQVTSKTYDLVLLEFGFDDFINSFNSIGGTGVTSGGGTDFISDIIEKYIPDETTKVCIANVPNFLKSPFINKVTLEMVNKGTLNTPFLWGNGNQSVLLTGDSRFIPNSEIDSLASEKVNVALKKGIAPNPNLNELSIAFNPFLKLSNGKTQYDLKIEQIAKERGYAIADLKGLYDKIYTRKYVEDGVLIDPNWPNGNFFSSDGIFPTPLGQALIANEYIKAINKKFESSIPLIQISEFVRLK